MKVNCNKPRKYVAVLAVYRLLALKAVKALYGKFEEFESDKPLWIDAVEKILCLSLNDSVGNDDVVYGIAFKPRRVVYWVDKGYLDNDKIKRKLLQNEVSIFYFSLDKFKNIRVWLKLRKLSDRVDVYPQNNGTDEEQTQGMRIRIEQRSRILKTYLRIKHKKDFDLNGKQIEAVKNLQLNISLDGNQIGSVPISHWVNDKLVYVSSEKKWRGLASAITDTHNIEDSAQIELILNEKDDTEVIERLKELGIPESELFEPEESDSLNVPTQTAIISGEQTRQTDSKITNSLSEATVTNSGTSGTSFGEQKNISTNQGRYLSSDSNRDQASKEAGEKAQEWLRQKLKSALLVMEWLISEKPERDKERKETDIILRKDSCEFHIEVKHTLVNEIFWSELEVKKAKELRKRDVHYVIAVLTLQNDESEDYYIKWFWDPLEEMKPCWSNKQVSGKWIWNKNEQHVKSEALKNLEPWDIPEKPQIEPTYFWYHIELNNVTYSANGLEAIKEQLNRFNG